MQHGNISTDFAYRLRVAIFYVASANNYKGNDARGYALKSARQAYIKKKNARHSRGTFRWRAVSACIINMPEKDGRGYFEGSTRACAVILPRCPAPPRTAAAARRRGFRGLARALTPISSRRKIPVNRIRPAAAMHAAISRRVSRRKTRARGVSD